MFSTKIQIFTRKIRIITKECDITSYFFNFSLFSISETQNFSQNNIGEYQIGTRPYFVQKIISVD